MLAFTSHASAARTIADVAAAVVGGAYPSFGKAQSAMCGIKTQTFKPIAAHHKVYQKLYKLYRRLHDGFGIKGKTLSMGDVLVLKQEGQITCHYVDKWGYVELPGFLSGRNPLRSLEDSLEQNDNQLDGIINNTPAPREPGPPKEARQPVAAEQPRKSVLEQIRKPATPEAAAKAQRQMQQLQR